MQLQTRKQFPKLLNELGLDNIAVEIGVCRGNFSKLFLQEWQGRVYNMVDPFTHQGAKLDVSDVSQQEHNQNFAAVTNLARGHNHRGFEPVAQVFREFSVEMAEKVAYDRIGELDFVYIDARHDYRSVAADLNAWYPLVKSGGIIAGHDYKDSFVRKNLVEVKRAVDDFFYGKETVCSTTDDNLPSWLVFKQ